MTLRIWAARAACLLILAGAFQPFYLRMIGYGRERFGRYAATLPFQKTPGLRAFMEGVRAHTHDGDRIAIVVPFTRWDGGYGYAFMRSTHVLAGRLTVPVVDVHDRPLANLDSADWVAAWHVDATFPSFASVWRNSDGVLLRRTR